MRSVWIGCLVVLVVASFGLGGSGARARAEEPLERAAATWRFDVRVLRLSTASATVEQAPTLPGMTASGVTTATWAEVLGALKARGQTQILMDRNVTGLSDRALRVSQSQTESVLQVRRTDATGGSFSETVPWQCGASVDLVVDRNAGRQLEYAVEVNWGKAAVHAQAPIILRTEWKGAQVLQGAGTLVLRHAEQEPESRGGTEIYALITWNAL